MGSTGAAELPLSGASVFIRVCAYTHRCSCSRASSQDMFAKLAEVASDHGILVLMACHRLNPGAWPGEGHWYDAVTTEERVKESWTAISRRTKKDAAPSSLLPRRFFLPV